MSAELKKREWVYVLPPSAYEMAACDCGNTETHWSEFEGHLWCEKCKKDFIPKHAGLFDGPICIELCRMMDIVFDHVNLKTNKLEIFHPETNEYIEAEKQPRSLKSCGRSSPSA